MENKKRVACVAYYTDSRYDELVNNVESSFLAFNGEECDFYQINIDLRFLRFLLRMRLKNLVSWLQPFVHTRHDAYKSQFVSLF